MYRSYLPVTVLFSVCEATSGIVIDFLLKAACISPCFQQGGVALPPRTKLLILGFEDGTLEVNCRCNYFRRNPTYT